MRAWIATLAAAAAASPAAAADKAPFGALTDAVKAGEIVLRDVCLPGIFEQKPIAPLAEAARLAPMPPAAAGAKPDAKAWRLGSLSAVYAVAWADGSCSTYVNTGDGAALRRMAETVILARPEGFVRGRSGLVDNGRVERTVYCAMTGDMRLVVSITTPAGEAARGTRALSSTAYRAPGPSPLCLPNPSAAAP